LDATVTEGAAPVEACALSKRYGAVTALDAVSIRLAAGEVHAIVGENGAGKSTLAKCIAGVVPADSGDVLVDGVARRLRSRREAIDAGIGFVPQSLSLVGALSLTENLLLGRAAWITDVAAAQRDLARGLERLHARLPLDVPAGRLSLAEQQLGEIALALAQGARILLLDEPTSTLGPMEVERLIHCVRDLAAEGVAVGLVTHRIVEVLKGADRVTVLRGGRLVHDGPTRGLSVDDLATFMVGERERHAPVRGDRKAGGVLLEARDLEIRENEAVVLSGASLSVRRGEILGVAGVAGPSQAALAEVLAGVRQPAAGSVKLDGRDITGKAGEAASLGVAYAPDTRPLGLVLERTVAENASLLRGRDKGFRRFGLRVRSRETQQGAAVAAAYDVRPPKPGLLAGGLSGGNQQKLMVGRELEREPAVIIVHGPTQGLDLAAASAIRRHLAAAADRGAAVVVISADLDEILSISDRMIVLAANSVADELPVVDGAVDMARLGRAMGGAA
jgi:ABC-type uncharacterized transport system ATPase subunit